MIVYAIVADTTGPQGHGEPGTPYVSLVFEESRYTIAKPTPLFKIKGEATQYMIDRGLNWKRIIELELR